MSRLTTHNPIDATGDLATTYTGIKRAMGKVPNVYATLGSNAPALLSQVLQLNASLQKEATFSRQELEAINLAVSEHSGCDYCLAAHTLGAKAAGYTLAQTRQLRQGRYPDDARIDALLQFALRLVRTRGTLPADALEAVRAAGFDDRQTVEAIGAVSAILFTNMLNRANDTTLDFPGVEAVV